MRLLIDTNRYAAIIGRDVSRFSHWQEAEELWLSLITIGELLTGFAIGTRRQENEQRLAQLLELQGVGVLIPDMEAARRYADVRAVLQRQGTKIPSNDVWIAAQAIQHDLTLDTHDAHFRYVPGLKLVDLS
jgi:predicted nucleic acid-binding protein